MSEWMIDAQRLCKQYGTHQVLKGIDLQIPAGSVVGLLGTNGSGKTTLMHCLLGLLRISAGSARVLGEDPWDLSPASKARLGYVPQQIHCHPWMQVGQVIEYTAAFYSSWDDQLTRRLIATWELNLKQQVSELSTGQLQRLGLVLGMGHRPALMILDEPAASLDPAGRRELMRLLLDSSDNSERTILFSSHITSDLERIASHVAILQDGRISWFGLLDDLKDSVKRVRITSDNVLPQQLAIPGALRTEVHGHTAVASVVDWQLESEQKLRSDIQADVLVEDLNLEDIFLELTHS